MCSNLMLSIVCNQTSAVAGAGVVAGAGAGTGASNSSIASDVSLDVAKPFQFLNLGVLAYIGALLLT